MAPSPHPSPPPARKGGAPGSAAGHRVERSAGGVVVRSSQGEPHILLIRDPYQRWGLPKGHLEGDESPEEAALREVKEETGLPSLTLGPDLGEIDWTFRREGRKVHKFCRFFLMASEEGEAHPEFAEGITECRWLPVAEATETVGYDNARGMIVEAARRIRMPDEPGELPWDPEEPS